jgi:molybdenum cofactor guanylyltransferase
VNVGRGESITAAILAGGRAQRVGGVDKGLAHWRGRALIAHVVEALSAQVDDLLIVANRNPGEYARYGRVCADRHAGYRGPLEGIVTAVQHGDSAWLLVVPVDSPMPGSDLLARLWQQRGDAAIAVAHDGVRRQPLFALYRRARLELPGDAQALNDRTLSVWAWQDQHSLREVDFSDSPARFANLNTAEDFRDALS